MDNKKVIVCDLDGTLAESKSTLSPEMAEVLCKVLHRHFLVIISGGKYSQFQKQFLSYFSCEPEFLKNLFLFPTNGSTCYIYDTENNNWKQSYNELLSPEEREKIIRAFNETIMELGLNLGKAYGEVVEDRGSQITFSAIGQEAPLEVKKTWDPDQTKRKEFVHILKNKIPEFEIRIGGMTSIDVTHKGIDKAYAIQKIKDLLKVTDDDIVFVGDALYKGGNDASVKETEVDFIQDSGPDETLGLLRQYL
ncbi:MAG: HAD-IIB family hydrolase [Candidatus Zambryskibacteria bacterium]|nr:HAD-IIB family hydrolase [Candidatus Zambryskibacteria bacterium]